MKKSRVVGLVTGAHVLAFGGLFLTQGCGTTRAPLPRESEIVMPPHQEEDFVRPVAVEPVQRPTPMPPAQPPEPDPVVVTPPAETTTYTVVAGDVLSVIARRFGVSMQDIMRINNISDPDMIRQGQRIELPGVIDLDQLRQVTTQRPTQPTASGDRYVVQAGDSLSVIAQRHGVSQQALLRVNNLSNPDRIQVGQELIIPEGGRTPEPTSPAEPPRETRTPPVTPPRVDPVAPQQPAPVEVSVEGAALLPAQPGPGGAQTYTIEIGDDLLSVASEFNVSIADLRAANNLDSDILVPGRVLVIPDAD